MAVISVIRRSAWARVRSRFLVALVVTVGAFVAVQAEVIDAPKTKTALAVILVWVLVFTRPSPWHVEWAPFWITVEPNWAAISRDYAIDPEDVRGFSDDAQAERYAAVKRISFTVLQTNLAFRHDHQLFFSETDIAAHLPGWEARSERREERILKAARNQPHDPSTDYVESVYVYLYSRAILESRRREDAGYELGITTEKSQERSHYPGDKEARVPLATLPYLAFACYWDSLDDTLSDDRRREIKDSLQRHGWTEEERHREDLIPWPTCLKHKYFTVYHDGV